MRAEAFVPRPHQKPAIRWLVERAEAALLLEPGLGKTTCFLKAYQACKKARAVNKALVVAPKRVCREVWAGPNGEPTKFTDFAGLRVALLHGDEKQDAFESDADLYVINPDGLPWLTKEQRLRSLLQRGVDLLIVDELSKFKDAQTQRFKLLKPYLRYFKRRWGGTGSPAPNGLIDLFGQAYIVDGGKSLGQYVTQYRQRFFVPSGFGGYDWKLQEGAEERIYEAIKPWALSMRAADHLDLPPLVERKLYVTLPEKVRRTYEQLEEAMFAALDDETITAANAAVATNKCRQVASGGIYVDTEGAELETATGRRRGEAKRKVVELHDAKTEALVELVETLQGQPLLVGYEYEHDLERIRAALGDVPAINGASRDKDVTEMIRAWNAGELPVLCGHPKAMAHGLNLQGGSGSHFAWYTLPWSQEDYDQAVRRIYRQGTKAKTVFVHQLVARDTVDEVVAATLASKTRGQNALMEALKAYVRQKRRAA